MDEHLPDLAALEWARFQTLKLAPGAPDAVRRHLESCGPCRDKVAAFADLERAMHPYGSAFAASPWPRRLRRGLAAALVLAALAAAAWMLF